MTQEITIPTPSAVVDQPTPTIRRSSNKKKPTRPTREELQALWDKEQVKKAKHSEMQAKYYKKKKEAGKKYVAVLVDTDYDKAMTDAGYKRIGIVYGKDGLQPINGFKSFRCELDPSISKDPITYLEFEYLNKEGEIYEIKSGPAEKARKITR